MQVACLHGYNLLSSKLSIFNSSVIIWEHREQNRVPQQQGLGILQYKHQYFGFLCKYIWDVGMDGFGILFVWFGFLTNQCHYAYISITQK